MRFGLPTPRRTRMISPTLSSSFRERLTVISHRDSAAASWVTGKCTNRIPFSSSSPAVSMASSIRQYITFAVLLTESPASAFRNGIQVGKGVAAIINSYSTCLVLLPYLVNYSGAVSSIKARKILPFHAAFQPPGNADKGKVALACIYVLSVISVQFCRFSLMLFLPLNLTAAFRPLWYAPCGLFFPATVHGVTSSGEHILSVRSSDWIDPSMNCTYHRTFLLPPPYFHKAGMKPHKEKNPRLWNSMV